MNSFINDYWGLVPADNGCWGLVPADNGCWVWTRYPMPQLIERWKRGRG